MILTSKKEIKTFLNNGFDIMILPYSREVVEESCAIFWKTDGKLFSWTRHIGRVERTDKTEEEIINHIASYIDNDDYKINAAGY